jgi:hypothetical protein
MPFVVVPSHINFLDTKGNIDEFIEVLQEIAEQYGEVKMVVIDTLSRAIAGGDENTSQDMSAVIYHADKIRAAIKTHVCFVHHSGKDKAKGARGHSSLRAAVDTEIEISRGEKEDFSTINFVKQRDIEMGEELYFKLNTVTLGENQYGEEVTSCVVTPHEKEERRVTNIKLTATEQFMYDTICEAMISRGKMRSIGFGGEEVMTLDYVALSRELEDRGFKKIVSNDTDISVEDAEEAVKRATNAVRIALKKKGKINFNKYLVWQVV